MMKNIMVSCAVKLNSEDNNLCKEYFNGVAFNQLDTHFVFFVQGSFAHISKLLSDILVIIPLNCVLLLLL